MRKENNIMKLFIKLKIHSVLFREGVHPPPPGTIDSMGVKLTQQHVYKNNRRKLTGPKRSSYAHTGKQR